MHHITRTLNASNTWLNWPFILATPGGPRYTSGIYKSSSMRSINLAGQALH